MVAVLEALRDPGTHGIQRPPIPPDTFSVLHTVGNLPRSSSPPVGPPDCKHTHPQPLPAAENVIATMCYIDLNPARAGIARRLEDCEDTSLALRPQRGTAPGRYRARVRVSTSGMTDVCGGKNARAKGVVAVGGPRAERRGVETAYGV